MYEEVEKRMLERIITIGREYVLIWSILCMIVGLFLLGMGVIYWFTDMTVDFIQAIGDWNAYILVIGLFVFGSGVWYLYSFETKKRFVMQELQTSKRSEFLKRHNEVKAKVKHLPSKYKVMLEDKEEELRVK